MSGGLYVSDFSNSRVLYYVKNLTGYVFLKPASLRGTCFDFLKKILTGTRSAPSSIYRTVNYETQW